MSVVDKPGVISRWANVRNVACMFWSTKIATLTAGTKVRIIAQTAWTKIVMPGGKVGWVGNDYISESSSWASVPALPKTVEIDTYCDTTNLARCPYPSAQWATPTWYTRGIPVVNNTTTSTSTNTTTTSATVNLDKLYTIVDGLVVNLINKMNAKYTYDVDKIKYLTNLIATVDLMTTKLKATYKPVFEYLSQKLWEELTLLQMWGLLNLE